MDANGSMYITSCMSSDNYANMQIDCHMMRTVQLILCVQGGGGGGGANVLQHMCEVVKH